LACIGGFLVLVSLIVYAIAYKTRFQPESEFNPQSHKYHYVRDAQADNNKIIRDAKTNEKVAEVPLKEIFSDKNFELYRKGDDLEVVLEIKNDPRDDSGSSKAIITIPRAANIDEIGKPRKDSITVKQKELEQAIANFNAPISIPRVVEIGVDDTNGINEGVRGLIGQHMGELGDALASQTDAVTLFLFRLSSTDYSNYQPVQIPAGTTAEGARQILKEKLDQWLAQSSGTKSASSLATGLFNNLKVNQKVRKRQIFIFSDGLENMPETAKFYLAKLIPTYLDRSKWDQFDTGLSKFSSFPNLESADVTWYFVPQDWIQYNTVRQYWEHVMKDRCKAKSFNSVY
jgi:hypothetical protein